MDYGHTPANIDADKTTPLGSEAPEQNLNSENWNSVSEQPFVESKETIERAMEPKMPQPTPAHDNGALGQITDLEPPSPVQMPISATINRATIHTENDHLTDAAIREVDSAIERLSQTGDLATFYEEARDLTEANLGNSYNHHQGEA